MALLKCPECGKQISDKAVSCPNCGCPIIFNGENSDKKSTNKTQKNQPQNLKKWVSLGVVAIAIIVVVCIFLMRNTKISDKDYAVYLGTEYIRSSILDPGSLIVYDAFAHCYDAEYENLRFLNDSRIPEAFNDNVIEVYIHYGARNSMGGITESVCVLAYDSEDNVVAVSDDLNAMNDCKLNSVQEDPNEFLCNQIALIQSGYVENVVTYTSDDINRLLDMDLGNKSIKKTSSFVKHTDEEKNAFLGQLIDQALDNNDVLSATFYKGLISDEKVEQDGQTKIDKYYYDSGINELDADNYESAREYFEKSNGFEDSDMKIKEAYYEEALDLEGHYPQNWDKIFEYFQNAYGYSDAGLQLETAKIAKEYQEKISSHGREDKDYYREIRPFFVENSDYKDCAEILALIDDIIASKWMGDWESDSDNSGDKSCVRVQAFITSDGYGKNKIVYSIISSDSWENMDNGDVEEVGYNGCFDVISEDELCDDELMKTNVFHYNGDGTINFTEKVYSHGFSFHSSTDTGPNTYTYTYKKVDE